MEVEAAGGHGRGQDGADLGAGIAVAFGRDGIVRGAAQFLFRIVQVNVVPGLEQGDGAGQAGGTAADNGNGPAAGFGREFHAGQPLEPGQARGHGLNVLDRQRAFAEDILHAMALALLVRRTDAAAHFRQHVLFFEDGVGAGDVLIRKGLEEGRDMDVRRAAACAGRLLAVAAAAGFLDQVVQGEPAGQPVLGTVNVGVAHDATGLPPSRMI